MSDSYIGKPNEYYMLRRAARRFTERLFTSGEFWDDPPQFGEVQTAVEILKSAAQQIPDKLIKRHWYWD